MRTCKPKDIQLAWHANAAGLPPEWDELLPPDHFLTRHVLSAHERADLPDITPVYVSVRQQGRLVAVAAFQVLSLQETHISHQALKPWQYRLWKLFANSVRPRLLVAGHLFRHDVPSFHHAEAVGTFDAFNLYLQAIRETMHRQHAQAVLVKEPLAAFVPYFQHYAPEYLMLRNDSAMQMDIPASWETLAGYEKSLKHKYAQRLRKVRQSWAGLKIAELTAAEVTDHTSQLYALYQQVTDKQPVRLGLLSPAFIPELKAFYGDRLRVWGIYQDESLIAFASAWVQQDSLDMFYIGFDYVLNASLHLYFNILFFAIEQAITLRKPKLILGRTALEAKARVGCRPEYLHTFLYIRNPLLRRIVSRLQARFAETTGEWENRHPFKKDPSATAH